jgi:hypothetical protein
MRLIPSCVAVFLSLCFDSFEYRPNACKTSSVVIGVVRIVAKYQPIVYYLLQKEFAFTDMTEAILSTIVNWTIQNAGFSLCQKLALTLCGCLTASIIL